MPKQKKVPYDVTLRFRGPSKLQRRIDRIIETRGYGNSADFMREGMSKLVGEEERRLGLPPIESTSDTARQEDDTALKPYGDKKIVAIPERRAHRPKVSYSIKLARKKTRQASRQKKSAA